jgi:hypothetical protein
VSEFQSINGSKNLCESDGAPHISCCSIAGYDYTVWGWTVRLTKRFLWSVGFPMVYYENVEKIFSFLFAYTTYNNIQDTSSFQLLFRSFLFLDHKYISHTKSVMINCKPYTRYRQGVELVKKPNFTLNLLYFHAYVQTLHEK